MPFGSLRRGQKQLAWCCHDASAGLSCGAERSLHGAEEQPDDVQAVAPETGPKAALPVEKMLSKKVSHSRQCLSG